MLQNVPVYIIVDPEIGGAQSPFNVHDCICSGSGDIGKIKPPDFVARNVIGDAAIPSSREALFNNLTGGLIDNRITASRRKMGHAIITHLRIADYCDLRSSRWIAELVDDDRRYRPVYARF